MLFVVGGAPGYVDEIDSESFQRLGEDVYDLDGGADYFGAYAVGGDRGDAVVWDGGHVRGRKPLESDFTNGNLSLTEESWTGPYGCRKAYVDGLNTKDATQ